MGGHALKTIKTNRINRTLYDELSIKLTNILLNTFKRVKVPRCYNNKIDFGDIDFIISLEDSIFDIRGYINNNFNPNEIFHNGNCWSFDYKNIQIDFIFVAPNNFDTMYQYMGFSDLGNFIGRLFHGFGLRYGQEGLWYEHYFKGKNVGKIHVSKDYEKIFSFIGLSFERYQKGFNELEDIFTYIVESPYFNWKKFQLEELNKVNRDRNKKRASYTTFLDWMSEHVADENHEYNFAEDKTSYFVMINNFFPEANIPTEVRRLEYLECKKLYIQSKFNGGNVMRMYGFEGKELGDKLTGFKNYIKDIHSNDYDDYIINNDEFDIYKDFEAFLTDESIKEDNKRDGLR